MLEEVIKSIHLAEKPASYSVSRLKTYQQCSYSYYHRYVLKTPVVSLSDSTITGSLVHNALEYLYKIEDDEVFYLIEAFHKTAINSLVDIIKVKEEEAVSLYGLLLDYAERQSSLYKRASTEYVGVDAIRKADGKVADNPSMTSSWKKAEKELGLIETRISLDSYVRERNKDLENCSICFAFSEALLICDNYRSPSALKEILAIEFPISHFVSGTHQLVNPVPIPIETKDTIYLNGYIDMIALVSYEGKEYKAIIDHKTSKSDYTAEDIEYNRQLVTYAYAYEYLTGEKIEVIGINNMRTNSLVLAKINTQSSIEAIHNLFSPHSMIEQQMFVKHIPEDKYSPCFNSFGKPCTYLKYCYPKKALYL